MFPLNNNEIHKILKFEEGEQKYQIFSTGKKDYIIIINIMSLFKGTVMQIEETLINNRLCVSKVT